MTAGSNFTVGRSPRERSRQILTAYIIIASYLSSDTFRPAPRRLPDIAPVYQTPAGTIAPPRIFLSNALYAGDVTLPFSPFDLIYLLLHTILVNSTGNTVQNNLIIYVLILFLLTKHLKRIIEVRYGRNLAKKNW